MTILNNKNPFEESWNAIAAMLGGKKSEPEMSVEELKQLVVELQARIKELEHELNEARSGSLPT